MKATKPFEISKRLVWQAYIDVKAKGGAAGVDKESVELFEVHLKDNLYRLWNRLSSGSYFLPPIKAVPAIRLLTTEPRMRFNTTCPILLPRPPDCLFLFLNAFGS